MMISVGWLRSQLNVIKRLHKINILKFLMGNCLDQDSIKVFLVDFYSFRLNIWVWDNKSKHIKARNL